MFSPHKPGDQNLKFSIYNQINSWASTLMNIHCVIINKIHRTVLKELN
jgi:hypothetical protein